MVPITFRGELFRRSFEHAILDSGVEIFHTAVDYPPNFKTRWLSIAYWTDERTKGKTWITVPDYPDDYSPGLTGNNVARTLENIKWFMGKDDSLPWLPVLQAKYLNPFSFFESCQRTKELLGDYPRVAIGTVCKTRKLDFIEYCCKVARTFFPRSQIHAFGLTLGAIPKVKDIIDSFDSQAYNFSGQPFVTKTGLKWRVTSGRGKKAEPFFDRYMQKLQKRLI